MTYDENYRYYYPEHKDSEDVVPAPEAYWRDASGYESRYRNLAIRLPEDHPCDRCGRLACRTAGTEKKELHYLCLRCWDDWEDYTEKPSNRINNRMSNWNEIYQRFCKTKPKEVTHGDQGRNQR